jgi:hypothetical protein
MKASTVTKGIAIVTTIAALTFSGPKAGAQERSFDPGAKYLQYGQTLRDDLAANTEKQKGTAPKADSAMTWGDKLWRAKQAIQSCILGHRLFSTDSKNPFPHPPNASVVEGILKTLDEPEIGHLFRAYPDAFVSIVRNSRFGAISGNSSIIKSFYLLSQPGVAGLLRADPAEFGAVINVISPRGMFGRDGVYELLQALDDSTMAGMKDAKEAAIAYYSGLIVAYNSSVAYYNRAAIYALSHRYGEAIEDFGRAIEQRGGYAEAHYERGRCYMAIGEKEKAQADFRKAKELRGY